jgi:hypothetical protein
MVYWAVREFGCITERLKYDKMLDAVEPPPPPPPPNEPPMNATVTCTKTLAGLSGFTNASSDGSVAGTQSSPCVFEEVAARKA